MLRKKRKTPKEETLSYWREEAWKAFSLYIRTRDSIVTTGTIDACICITCFAVKPRLGIGSIQAGHFPEINGRLNAVLFEERGVHGQCYQCNHFKHGNPNPYMDFMKAVYGQEVIDELIALKHKTVKYSIPDYQEIKQDYMNRAVWLANNPQDAILPIPEGYEAVLPF